MSGAQSGDRRLLVTGHDADGKSVFKKIGVVAENKAVHTPGFSFAGIWATTAGFEVPDLDDAFRTQLPSQHASPGESRFMIVTLPPDAVMMSPSFDAEAAGAEMLHLSPGIAERFEQVEPGMHTTDTLDYDIVLSGEIWLELDNGHAELMKAGDIAVQNGTRHAWRNRSDSPTVMAFIMLGGKRRGT